MLWRQRNILGILLPNYLFDLLERLLIQFIVKFDVERAAFSFGGLSWFLLIRRRLHGLDLLLQMVRVVVYLAITVLLGQEIGVAFDYFLEHPGHRLLFAVHANSVREIA